MKSNKELIITDLSKQLSKRRLKILKDAGIKLPSSSKKSIKMIPDKVACVFEFNGDVDAKQSADLADFVNVVLSDVERYEEVFIKINSPGGTVNGYGLAAYELKRLKDAGIRVTALVDRVAASGGYMLACAANSIVAAPFAYIGSIGVVLEMPNANRFLEKHGITMVEATAGEKKRGVTMLGELTDDKRKHLDEKLLSIHEMFKRHVLSNRPIISESGSYENNKDEIFSGDHWSAVETVDKEMKLVDDIQSSEEFLLKQMKNYRIVKIEFKTKKKKSLVQKLLGVNMSEDFALAFKSALSDMLTKVHSDNLGLK